MCLSLCVCVCVCKCVWVCVPASSVRSWGWNCWVRQPLISRLYCPRLLYLWVRWWGGWWEWWGDEVMVKLLSLAGPWLSQPSRVLYSLLCFTNVWTSLSLPFLLLRYSLFFMAEQIPLVDGICKFLFHDSCLASNSPTKSFWTPCVPLLLFYMCFAYEPTTQCSSLLEFCVSIKYKLYVLEFCVSIKYKFSVLEFYAFIKYKFCVLEFCVSIKYKFRLNVSSGSTSPLLANCRQKGSRHDPPLATSTRPCEVSCHKIQVKTTRKYNTTNIYHGH